MGKVPTEKRFLGYGWTCIDSEDMPFFQRNIPNIQVSDISKKWLCEIPSKWILVLTQNEYAISIYISGSICAWAHVLPVPIHIDFPVATTSAPCDTDMMPSSIIGEKCLVWQMLPMDDEGQEDASLHVHLAP